MKVSFCQLTTTANHGAGKFDPREMTLSSILYIIILEINNIILYWGRYAHASAHVRARLPDFEASKKNEIRKKNF